MTPLEKYYNETIKRIAESDPPLFENDLDVFDTAMLWSALENTSLSKKSQNFFLRQFFTNKITATYLAKLIIAETGD